MVMRSIANRRKWVQFPSQPVKVGPVKVGPVKVGRSKGRDQGEEKKGRKEGLYDKGSILSRN